MKAVFVLLSLAGLALADDCQKPENESKCIPVLLHQDKPSPVVAKKRAAPKPKEVAKREEPNFAVPDGADRPQARTIKMSQRDIIPINCARRYEVLLVAPPNEHIVEAGTGDPERWDVKFGDKRSPNAAHILPRIAGSRTNLNIRTDAGHTYTFALVECGGTCTPDLKIFIESTTANEKPLMAPSPVEVGLSAEVENQKEMIARLEQDLEKAMSGMAQTKKEADQRVKKEVSDFRAKYPLTVKTRYRFEANKAPFYVRDIWHDDSFTYIKVGGSPPAVYGDQDGDLSALQRDFQLDPSGHGGTVIVSSVIKKGRLSYGSKNKLDFAEEEVR